jgi:hypothetical protein
MISERHANDMRSALEEHILPRFCTSRLSSIRPQAIEEIRALFGPDSLEKIRNGHKLYRTVDELVLPQEFGWERSWRCEMKTFMRTILTSLIPGIGNMACFRQRRSRCGTCLYQRG